MFYSSSKGVREDCLEEVMNGSFSGKREEKKGILGKENSMCKGPGVGQVSVTRRQVWLEQISEGSGVSEPGATLGPLWAGPCRSC